MTKYSRDELVGISPKEFRSIIRRGEWTERTSWICPGYVETNMAAVPKEYAFEFLLFCNRNPAPCPVIEVTEPGDPHPKLVAPDVDLRTDLPKYRVFKDGQIIDEPTNVKKYWRDDMVAFLIGCGSSLWPALDAANVQYRVVGVFVTNIPCIPAGRFEGPMAVLCLFVKGMHNVLRTVQISSRHILVHGAPVHIGDPTAIGIEDLDKPEIPRLEPLAPQGPDEVAMFWGAGLTPQLVSVKAKLPIMITHHTTHLLVTDRRPEELAIM